MCIYVVIYTYTTFQHFIRFLCSFRSTAALRKAWTATTTGEMGDTYPSSQQSGIGEEPPKKSSWAKYTKIGSCQNTGSSKQWIKWRWSLFPETSYKWILRRFAQKKTNMTRFRQAPISKYNQKLKFQPRNDWKSHTVKWRLPCYASCLQVSRRRFPWKNVCFPTIFVHLLTAFEMTTLIFWRFAKPLRQCTGFMGFFNMSRWFAFQKCGENPVAIVEVSNELRNILQPR